MQICQRMGWTIGQYLLLPDTERRDWEAWELRRQKQLVGLLERIQYEKTEDDGTVKHYVHDYNAYIEILKELYR